MKLYFFLTFILFIAAIYDLRFKRIPNWLTFPSLIFALIYHTIMDGFTGFLFSIEGICVGIATLMIFYLMGWMGAGDVKIMGAVGGVLGPNGVFIAFLCTAIVGGLYAIVLLAFHGYLKETFQRYGMILKDLIFFRKFIYLPPSEQEKKPQLRYGIAIALGTLGSLFIGNVV